MAWQHFYSRVPARVSMYNRADSFDTFAQSAGLTREFVERELAFVYENKLNKNDITVIRKGEMPCVYTQCSTRSGALVQNCISYLPLDYTGERSAYLSHSLVYTPEEKKQVLTTGETILHPGLFVTDVSGFDLTAPGATPDAEYPEKAYTPSEEPGTHWLAREVYPETARSFLYAVLNALCGKGRNVFFKLSGDEGRLSQSAVELFNELLSILPYQLRGGLSFASYVTDPTQYANHKLKGVCAQFPDNAAAKCVYFDFETNLIVGVQHDEVVANKALLSFFYSLLENKALREEFLGYMERAAEAVPGLQNLNLKVLSSLVFLFQCSCGLFPEQEILPNDNMVYEYLCAYEKYRVALNEEYRMQAYRCMQRYPLNHLAIPKNIFAKASRLYSTEPRSAKRIFMNIVLELIHTDIMRDKLFAFIRSNYKTEDPDVKEIIIADLSRVFYGGFLQNQILTFFSEQFPEESEASKSLIVEKLLLSIRTPAVQGKILAFIDEHYENLSTAHRDSFYDTFLEMLPECDALADTLVKMVSGHIEKESPERKEQLARRLTEVLENDYRRREHNMMPILVAHPGFCRDLVEALVFGPWQSRKIYGEYLQLLKGRSVSERTEALVRAFTLVPELDKEKLLPEAIGLYTAEGEGDLYLWLELAEQLKSLPRAFAQKIHITVVEPNVAKRAEDVFDTRWRTDGIVLLEAYAKKHPTVMEGEAYRTIKLYQGMIERAEAQDYPQAADLMEQLRQREDLAGKIAGHMAACAMKPATQTPGTVLCLELLQGILLEGVAPIGKAYRKRADYDTAENVMELLLSVCLPISVVSSVLPAMTDPRAGVESVVTAFSTGFGKGAHHWLKNRLPAGHPFGDHLEEKLRGQKSQSTSFLSKLFGKKK